MSLFCRSSLLPILVMFLVTGNAAGQNQVQPDIHTVDGLEKLRQQQQNPHARIFALASNLRDYPTAIYALHQLLLEDPDNGYLQDSLAYMYARTGNTVSCLAWCKQCLDKRPDSFFLLNLSGNLLESENRPIEALQRFETLYAHTGSQFYRYKVTVLQYTLGRYGECLANIESMLADSNTQQEMVRLSWDADSQEVPLQAALLNLRGNLELALNQEGNARKSFRAALKVAPDFDLARNNLRALDEKNRQRFDRGNDR